MTVTIFRRHVYFTAICIKSNPFAFYFLIIVFRSYFPALLVMYNYLGMNIKDIHECLVVTTPITYPHPCRLVSYSA